jgi:hypothetical protein
METGKGPTSFMVLRRQTKEHMRARNLAIGDDEETQKLTDADSDYTVVWHKDRYCPKE